MTCAVATFQVTILGMLQGPLEKRPASAARPIFWFLLAAVVLIAGVETGLHFYREHVNARDAKRAQAAAEAAKGRDQRVRLAAAVALAPLPVRSPLVERPGTDEFGYPLSYVDRAALRSLLGRGKFVELSAYAEDFQKRFEADFRTEYFIRGVSDAFDSPEPELGPALDAWVKATPASFAPYLARGSHHVARGFAGRGADVVTKTDSSNFQAMRQAFALARIDLDRALELSPRLVAALRHLMVMSYVASGRRDFAALSGRAFELCPGCMQPRVVEQHALEPRWGGSYREMKAAADAAPVQLNPRLRLLPGYAEIDRADGFVVGDQLERALQHAERAVKLGEHADFLSTQADILWRLKNPKAARVALSRALELTPSSDVILFELAEVETALKDYRAAFRHLHDGLRIDPTSAKARRVIPDVVSGLTFIGWEAHKQGKNGEALEILDEAAELDPNRDVEHRRVAVLTSGFQGTEAELAALEQAAAKAPGDFFTHARLDYALATKRDFARIEALWTRYLDKNPTDSRAYRERAGTFMAMRRPKDARADAQRACDLGSSAGCALTKRF